MRDHNVKHIRGHGETPSSEPIEEHDSPIPYLPPSHDLDDLRSRKHRGPDDVAGRGDRGIGGNRKRR
jgi:hypothetical protein